MLINLSNHSSQKWGHKQWQAAQKQFGNIEDFPFPDIPPEWSFAKVQQKAGEIMEQMMQKYGNCSILIAGEQSFVVAFVEVCRLRELPCYCACSERHVTENEDGSKNVKFNFVQFRKMN